MLIYTILIILYVISISIGYINEYYVTWVNMPEYISLIIIAIILLLNIIIWIKKEGKKVFKAINIIVSIVSICIVLFNTYCNPYWNSVIYKYADNLSTKSSLEVISYEDAKEDIDYAMKYLKKVHPALRKEVPQEINEQYNKVIMELQQDAAIRVEEVQVAIESIYNIMNDKHTRVNKGDIITGKSFNSDADINENFISFTIDKENNLAVLLLNECIYNDRYIECINDMFKNIKEENIQNVVIDLRKNGGGNSTVANEFIRYLNIDEYKTGISKRRRGMFVITEGEDKCKNDKYEDLLFKGNVYILTSSATFSSAMTFTELIKENDLGTIIGESPGNPPNCYIDCSVFLTPNAKVQLWISTKQSYAINRESKEELIQPDIKCSADKAMEVLLENL